MTPESDIAQPTVEIARRKGELLAGTRGPRPRRAHAQVTDVRSANDPGWDLAFRPVDAPVPATQAIDLQDGAARGGEGTARAGRRRCARGAPGRGDRRGSRSAQAAARSGRRLHHTRACRQPARRRLPVRRPAVESRRGSARRPPHLTRVDLPASLPRRLGRRAAHAPARQSRRPRRRWRRRRASSVRRSRQRRGCGS